MNQGEILLFTWVKFLALRYGLIDSSYINKLRNILFEKNFNEEFIFNFFIKHFNLHKKGVSLIELNMNIYEKINIIKYFLEKNFNNTIFQSKKY